MQFTVVFQSPEGQDNSFGLVFIPCAVWVRGNDQICIPNRQTPQYELGSVRQLLNSLPKQAAINSRTTPQICVVTHPTGHGTAEDLKCLLTDLADEGFSVTTSDLGHG